MTLEQRTPDVPARDGRPTVDVAVVVPVRDRAEMLDRALRSVATQTVRPTEVVVVDDVSSDASPDVALAHGATLVRMPENGGSGRARNAGITHATATWVAFLDSDDEWLPRHLELLVAAGEGEGLVTAPSVTTTGLVMGNAWRRPLRLSPRRLLVPGNVITTSGTMVRRELLNRVGGFRPLPRAQDLDLWLRVMERAPGVALPRPTVLYHMHDTQASSDWDATRRCFDDIIDSHATSSWMDARLRQQAYARVHWDEARAAQRAGRSGEARARLGWLARRPRTWLPLLQLFAARRASRFPLAAA
ncbi:glycosyltransferase family 2 protein [Aquipuribacter nitratireducens]|uniref:Glycosyltransferase family 2 protein n=1 Tax=Aquipuribacter nitratireducens TaxID=650104 RepID=A0ABW0GPG4_9MICO